MSPRFITLKTRSLALCFRLDKVDLLNISFCFLSSGIIQSVREIYKEEGISGLFAGIIPQLMGDILTLWIFRGLTFCVNKVVSAEVSYHLLLGCLWHNVVIVCAFYVSNIV